MDWHIIAAAIVTGTAVHGAMEPQNVNVKLNRLGKAIKTGKIEELQLKGIDTRPKAYSAAALGILLISIFSFLIINWIDPGFEATMQYIIVTALFGEAVLVYGLDKYHVAIEKLTQAQKK